MKSTFFNLKGDELEAALKKVQDIAGYHFSDGCLLIQALTHPSFAAECLETPGDNQRLEFLGDAVLEIILSSFLYKNMPKAQEGLLTRTRSFLANEEATAQYARKLGLDKVLQLGKGECNSNGRERDSILGDAFESFLGAVYLDGGYDAAKSICLGMLPDLAYVSDMLVLEENPKGSLQILTQGNNLGRPVYEKVKVQGPVHQPIYEIRVTLNGRELGRGSGASSKLAEREAAKAAYYKLKRELEGDAFSEVATGLVLALDFDGVICDSARETGISGWKAAHALWPDDFPEPLPTEEQINAFRKVRPYLETGFHSILLTRMLRDGVPFKEFQNDIQGHFKRIIEQYGLDKQLLISLFGSIRDAWIQEDMEGWLGNNGIYPGVADALNSVLQTGCKVLILTTKQERFVNAQLQHFGVNFPIENIWGLERKRKKEELLAAQLKAKPTAIHFVEDRLETLLRVESDPALENVKLHYADWGYGTEEHLAVAKSDPHIEVLSLDQFNAWLTNLSSACGNN